MEASGAEAPVSALCAAFSSVPPAGADTGFSAGASSSAGAAVAVPLAAAVVLSAVPVCAFFSAGADAGLGSAASSFCPKMPLTMDINLLAMDGFDMGLGAPDALVIGRGCARPRGLGSDGTRSTRTSVPSRAI